MLLLKTRIPDYHLELILCYFVLTKLMDVIMIDGMGLLRFVFSVGDRLLLALI